MRLNFIALSQHFWKKILNCIILTLLLASEVQTQTEGFYPYTMNWSVSADSPASLSFLLEPPTGKYDFIESSDGHTVYPDGRRFRMWGVNMATNILFSVIDLQRNDIRRVLNKPMVDDPFQSNIVQLSRSAVAGKPNRSFYKKYP